MKKEPKVKKCPKKKYSNKEIPNKKTKKQKDIKLIKYQKI